MADPVTAPVSAFQESLVDALCAVQFMTTPTGRQLFVEHISEGLGGVDIRFHPGTRHHVIEIVRTCQREGGLHVLVGVLSHLAPRESATLQVQLLVDSSTVQDVIPDDAREQVRGLLRRGPQVAVKALWYAAAGDAAPLPSSEPRTLVAAFDHLVTINARWDGLPPALAFIEYAAAQLHGGIAVQLRRWNEAQARRYALVNQLNALRVRIASEPLAEPAQACLVVQIEPAGNDSGRYQLSHWVQHRPGKWQPERGDEEKATAAELEQAVERLVNRAETTWSDQPGEVLLEFVLPLEMLNDAVDWWCRDAGTVQAVPLCLDYPVVLRSLERMRAKKWHRPWRNRWEAMRRAPAHTHWAPADHDDDSLRPWNQTLRSDPGLTSVALASPPDSHGRRVPLHMALQAGIPVAFWDRRSQRPKDFGQTVTQVLTGPPAQLPERVKRLRAEADKDSHTGRHLAVLWDDPTRLVHFPPPPVGGEPAGDREASDRQGGA